jgi:hypothetical protein
VDRVTRAKIESLLYEVRRAAPKVGRPQPPWDPEAIARRYQLDPMIVRALLESEGVPIVGAPDVEDSDPNGSTQVMNIDDLAG